MPQGIERIVGLLHGAELHTIPGDRHDVLPGAEFGCVLLGVLAR
ncbi:hypothetical protein [Streptomyces purpurogeneiscleroticus]|nr:hypothetical protein [Streptomyces purpurogeneiscleroticus]